MRNLWQNQLRCQCRSNRSIETSFSNVTFRYSTPKIIFWSYKTSWSSTGHLLLENPSDLFQIEVSYIYDGEDMQDVTLILHVPMAQKCAILCLFHFLPFPLPFLDIHFLVPRPHHNLFAISSNEPGLSIDLTEADLEGCYKVSNVHLCEWLGVLQTGHEGSCLGSL